MMIMIYDSEERKLIKDTTVTSTGQVYYYTLVKKNNPF